MQKDILGKTDSRLVYRFREHLRDVERNNMDASKPVATHVNLSDHSKQHMVVCGLSLQMGSLESLKTFEQQFIYQIGTLNAHGINERLTFKKFTPVHWKHNDTLGFYSLTFANVSSGSAVTLRRYVSSRCPSP